MPCKIFHFIKHIVAYVTFKHDFFVVVFFHHVRPERASTRVGCWVIATCIDLCWLDLRTPFSLIILLFSPIKVTIMHNAHL